MYRTSKLDLNTYQINDDITLVLSHPIFSGSKII